MGSEDPKFLQGEGPEFLQDSPGAGPAFKSPGSAGRLIRELAEYSGKIAQSVSREIKSGSRNIAAGQLTVASGKLDILAEALREAAGKLREKSSYSLANIMEAGSESMMRLADNLRRTSPEMIIGEVEDFARDKPMIFLGSAVVAGILLAQIFSSAGEGDGAVQGLDPQRESSVEYRPGHDEGDYYGPH